MKYPPSLEQDLGTFFNSLFYAPAYKTEAARVFDACVLQHSRNLLTEDRTYTSLQDQQLKLDPWAKDHPQQALTLLELFVRAVAATKDQMLRSKKIDVRKMLAERVKKTKPVRVRRIV